MSGNSTQPNSMRPPDHPPRRVIAVRALVVVGTASIIAAVALWYFNPRGAREGQLPQRAGYELDGYTEVDESLVGYRKTSGISLRQAPAELARPVAITVGPDDAVYVVGDQRLLEFASDGGFRRAVDLPAVPSCVAVAPAEGELPEQVLVGLGNRVAVLDRAGSVADTWQSFGEKARITAIAAGAEDVFLADAGNRIVHRVDRRGEIVGELGRRDPDRNIVGFVIPSPYFDLALAPDGLLRVVNPGVNRIEIYTPRGDLELYWGKASISIEGFCGCCNPANIAILPDSSVVTAEKGLPRVKVYEPTGDLRSVVAPPRFFADSSASHQDTRDDVRMPVLDVAADSRGQVYVLEPGRQVIHVFAETTAEPDQSAPATE